jgi:hypothetical protein
MTSLTRRRDPDSREEAWLIFYGDVRVGSIGRRSGNPVGTDAWFWRCGFTTPTFQGKAGPPIPFWGRFGASDTL